MKISKLCFALLLTCPLSFQACSIYKAATAPSPVEVQNLRAGMERPHVMNILGYPKLSEVSNGERVDMFEYTNGNHPASKLRILLYAGGDLFTLGLAELIFWPMELAFLQGSEERAAVTYGSDDKVRSIKMTNKDGTLLAEVKKQEPTTAFDVDAGPPFTGRPSAVDLAVVIGIEKYQKLIPARHAQADAEQVAKYLRSLGYAPRNIELLLNEQATQNGIRQAIELWLPERVRHESRVLVYYSGHGSHDPTTGEAYLVPHDGNPGYLTNTAYPVKLLYEELGKLQVRQVIVAMDSCFSGQGGRSVIAAGVRPAVVMVDDPLLRFPNLAVIAASQRTQISTSSEKNGHGVFTYHFLKALQNGEQDLGAIYEYLSPRVEDEAKLLQVDQTPTLRPGTDKVRGHFLLWEQLERTAKP